MTAFALAGIAVLYLILQFLITSHDRFVEWDEAVYLSQILPDGVPVWFGPHRARGVLWLTAPAAHLLGFGTGLRVYLSVLAALGLFGAYFSWLPLIGRAVIGAATLFAFSWLSLFYASAVSPNLPMALVAVALVALILLPRRDAKRLFAIALLMAAAAVLRPLDAVTLALASGICVIARERRFRSAVAPLVAMAGGALIGAVPWLIDSQRFGGPSAAMERTRELTQSGPTLAILEHLALTDGPLVGPDVSGGFPWQGSLWWIGLVLLSAVAIALGRGRRREAAAVGAFVGAVMASPYLFLTGVSAPRFLIPTYALVGIPTAIGFAELMKMAKPRVRGVLLAASLGILLAWSVWQMDVASHLNYREVRGGQVALALAERLDKTASGRCAFAIPYGLRPVEFASRCTGFPLSDDMDTAVLEQLRSEGYTVFLVTTRRPPIFSNASSWTRLPFRGLRVRTGWQIYAPPSQV